MLNVGRRALFATLLFVALLPSAARAQEWDVTGLVGVGLPAGDLDDDFDPGFSATLSTTRWFGSRYGLRFGGAGNFLSGNESLIASVSVPNTSFWHYNVGPEITLMDPATNLGLRVHAGIGATTAQPDGASSSTDFTLNLGVTLEGKLSPAWSIIGGPSLYIIMDDETGYILPISAGVRYLFGTH